METKYYEEMREGMRQRIDGANQPLRYDKLYRSPQDDTSLNEAERAELLKRRTIEEELLTDEQDKVLEA